MGIAAVNVQLLSAEGAFRKKMLAHHSMSHQARQIASRLIWQHSPVGHSGGGFPCRGLPASNRRWPFALARVRKSDGPDARSGGRERRRRNVAQLRADEPQLRRNDSGGRRGQRASNDVAQGLSILLMRTRVYNCRWPVRRR